MSMTMSITKPKNNFT